MYWIYIIGLIFVVIIGITQSYFGYNEHKVLGWIFPIVFIGFNIWFLMNGTLEFSISDIFRPFIGLAPSKLMLSSITICTTELTKELLS